MKEHEVLVKSSHGVSQNTFHLIWCTKYRYPVFKTERFKRVVRNIIISVAEDHNIHVFECVVMNNHIHLFVRLPREMSVTRAFQLLKGASSLYIRRFAHLLKRYKALWSSFTFSRTVGSVTGAVIERYISETHTNGRYGSQRQLSHFANQ